MLYYSVVKKYPQTKLYSKEKKKNGKNLISSKEILQK